MHNEKRALVLGSTGAVGTELTRELIQQPSITGITLLVRRNHPLEEISQSPKVTQQLVDVFDPIQYRKFIPGHTLAFSTLGVGQPSKITQEELVRTDFDCVRTFAGECKEGGVEHFSSLGAVGASTASSIFYLKVKGQLEESLVVLGFPRTSLFRPSMIITPENRYDWMQAVMLKLYPLLDVFLVGTLSRYRSIRVAELGKAIARNAMEPSQNSVERLEWKDFKSILGRALRPGT